MHLSAQLVICLVSMFVRGSLTYDCYVENCDWNREFCNHRQQRCENCAGHLHSCFSNKMEENCTTTCLDNEHQKLKGQGCHGPPNVTAGHVVEPREFYEHGSEVINTCMPGYRLLGNPKSICGDYGQWTSLPLCEVVTCPALPKVEHGRMEYSEDSDSDTLPVKTTARLACDDGYVRHGTLDNHCSETGQWTDSIPFCVKEKDSCLNPEVYIPLFFLFIPLAILVYRVGPRLWKYVNKHKPVETKNNSDETKGLMQDNADNFKVNMDALEHESYDVGVSKGRDKLEAEPVPSTQTMQRETTESQDNSDRHREPHRQQHLSSSESDVCRSDLPPSVSTSGSSRSEDSLGYSTSNVDEPGRREPPAISPTLSRSSETNSKSKDSGFDSSNTINLNNNGPNNGNAVQIVIYNHNYSLKDNHADAKDVVADTVSTVAKEETGETTIPEQPSTEAVAETTECKD